MKLVDILGVTTNTFEFVGGTFNHDYVTGGGERTRWYCYCTEYCFWWSRLLTTKKVVTIENTPSDGITTVTIHGKKLSDSLGIVMFTILLYLLQPFKDVKIVMSVNDVVKLTGIDLVH